MLEHVRPALVLLLLFSVLTGIAYPFAVTGVAHVALPNQAAGSLVIDNGQVRGSALIGQSFTSERYFHGRPSATTDTDPSDPNKTIAAPYNAANSVGSNYGPTSAALKARIADALAKLKAENPAVAVPPELVYASGSGLDPDISPAAAVFQIPRIAKARGLSPEALTQLVAAQTEDRALDFLGEPHLNVLALNQALDQLTPAAAHP